MMKVWKRVGLTVLGLLAAALCAWGILGLTGCAAGERQAAVPTDESEKGSANQADTESQTDTDDTDDTDAPQTDAQDTLLDMEDYTDAPADNGCPYYIKVNRQENVVTVYALDEDGRYTEPVRAMVCSVGKEDGTPTGTFAMQDKHSWCSLVGGVYGQYAYRIDGQIMFHSVPYYSMDKGDLETEEYNKLGEAASLGCIRLAVADAKWIYDYCPAGTLVTIYDSDYIGPLGKPAAEKLDTDDARSGWDPTDPDTENPWQDGRIRILGAGDCYVQRGSTWQQTCGIRAYDGDGQDITDRVRLVGEVDIDTVGEYPVTYQVTDDSGKTARATGTICVMDQLPPLIAFTQDTITLNHAEASDANCKASILHYIRATDEGETLKADSIEIDVSALEGQTEGEYPVIVTATDAAGNRSEEQTLMVSLDRVPPVIQEPAQKSYTGSSEADIRAQLLDALVIEDAYSGVDEVQVSWTPEPGTDTYSLLVTARDTYGNVSTQFFNDFSISYESAE